MKKIILAALASVSLLMATPTIAAPQKVGHTSPARTTTQVGPMSTGYQGYAIQVVQYRLRSYGYAIGVDGVFGPVTERIVRLWQKHNGLVVDGIVGPQTLRSLGLSQADLVQPQQVNKPQIAAAPTLNTGGTCQQYEYLFQANGMPVQYFSAVSYRESGCNPRAYNGRGADDSYGLLQLNTEGALWGELKRRCGLTTKDSLFDPVTNIKCAGTLYRVYGLRPWRTN